MFCLRIWLLPLFFLSSAPPLYLLLFLSATYILQRPCVYCSLLLAILILVLFDFSGNWFEPQLEDGTSSSTSSDSSEVFQDVLLGSMSALTTTLNGTAAAIVDGAIARFAMAELSAEGNQAWLGWGGEWLKTIFTRRELRVPCVNAIIRL